MYTPKEKKVIVCEIYCDEYINNIYLVYDETKSKYGMTMFFVPV